MELREGDYLTGIPDEKTFNRLVSIMQECLTDAFPGATEYTLPWERHKGKGTLVWDDDNSIYWVGLEPEDLGRGRAKRKVSIEDVLSLEETEEEEIPEVITKEIEEGDYFVVDDMASSMKVTKHKIYQCTSVSEDGIHFIDDEGNEDYHLPIWFKKVEAPKFSVGEVITLSGTGGCCSTHSKASTWGLNNYSFDSYPKVNKAYTITAVFYYEGKFIYALVGDDSKEYLSGNKYFNRVLNSAENSVTNMEEKETKTPETAVAKSVGADDLIGKRFISGPHTVEIRHTLKHSFDVRFHYIDNPDKDWDVALTSVRNWIKDGNLIPVEEYTSVADNEISGIAVTQEEKPMKNYVGTGFLVWEGQDDLFKYPIVKQDDNYFYVKSTGNGGEYPYEMKNIIYGFNKNIKLHTIDPIPLQDIIECKAKLDSAPHPTPLTENPQWQHYNEQTETYSIKQEENTMNKTNQIVITVPTSPLAVTTTTTMFGAVVDATNEEGLHALLARINSEQDALKAINKTAKSSRVTGQINKLGAARNKVVEMLDALPEEGENES